MGTRLIQEISLSYLLSLNQMNNKIQLKEKNAGPVHIQCPIHCIRDNFGVGPAAAPYVYLVSSTIDAYMDYIPLQ